MGTGTFDAATRTALHFFKADQAYLSCYFYLKTFKNIKKDFKIQTVRQILTHFYQKKNIATFLDKGKIVNVHIIYLFTPALRQICNSCLQIPSFTKSFVSRKPITIVQICKMLLKQNIISYISV